ncbi:MAG: hypothetical protein C4549_03510 [Deltaproteobacteria bacterium]|nr:MAG: hypothetical protein C4549_03510 [Deltaproteobacteria bacterium]
MEVKQIRRCGLRVVIKFSSHKEAKSKGYRACKVCSPPED